MKHVYLSLNCNWGLNDTFRRRHPIGWLQVCWVVIGQSTKDVCVRSNFSLVISRFQHHYFHIMTQHVELKLAPLSWRWIILLRWCVRNSFLMITNLLHCYFGSVVACNRYSRDERVCYPGKIRSPVTRKLFNKNNEYVVVSGSVFMRTTKTEFSEIRPEITGCHGGFQLPLNWWS